MADIFSKAKRSEIMSRISGKETKPEVKIRQFLFAKGLRFRKNVKFLPGTPDIVLPKYRSVIFVHGCFWHGHKNCKKSALPSTNKDFWINKISRNYQRDVENIKILEGQNWRVFVVWQCELSNREKFMERCEKLYKGIQRP